MILCSRYFCELRVGQGNTIIISEEHSILKNILSRRAIIKIIWSPLSCISVNLFRVILCVVLVSPLVSFPAVAFDIYIPGKKEFKLTNKGGSNSYTETKTWLEQDHHIVLHFMDLFGLPLAGVPEGAMKEETAVLATNAALIGNDINLFNIYKGENWGERKELEPDADFGTIYYKRFDAKKPLKSKCVAFFGYNQHESDIVFGIYCKAKELTDSEVGVEIDNT